MPAGGFTFRCSSMYWQGQTYFSPWRPGTRLLRLSLFLTASVPHRPAYRRNRRAPRSCERKDNITFINATKTLVKVLYTISNLKTCQKWRHLVSQDRDVWANRCRAGNKRVYLWALCSAILPQHIDKGRAPVLNVAGRRGCRLPRQESSRAGGAGSLSPTAAGTGGTLALPYPAHSYALLTHQKLNMCTKLPS